MWKQNAQVQLLDRRNAWAITLSENILVAIRNQVNRDLKAVRNQTGLPQLIVLEEALETLGTQIQRLSLDADSLIDSAILEAEEFRGVGMVDPMVVIDIVVYPCGDCDCVELRPMPSDCYECASYDEHKALIEEEGKK